MHWLRVMQKCAEGRAGCGLFDCDLAARLIDGLYRLWGGQLRPRH
jgi:hypothetical protein